MATKPTMPIFGDDRTHSTQLSFHSRNAPRTPTQPTLTKNTQISINPTQLQANPMNQSCNHITYVRPRLEMLSDPEARAALRSRSIPPSLSIAPAHPQQVTTILASPTTHKSFLSPISFLPSSLLHSNCHQCGNK